MRVGESRPADSRQARGANVARSSPHAVKRRPFASMLTGSTAELRGSESGPACDGSRPLGALISVEKAWTSSIDPDFPLSIVASRRLRQVLVARFGMDAGAEAYQEAMAYAWEHRDRLSEMDNPVGYLYRVAQTAHRRQRRWARRVALPPVPEDRIPEVEPGLPDALARLSTRQRVAVLLVHAHGWTQVEAATVLDIDVSTLRNHLRRGLEQLRTSLGVDDA